MGRRSVLLVPARVVGVGPEVLPEDYQRIMAIVAKAAGPVAVKEVGTVLGLPVEVQGKLEPLHGKMYKLADRGWLRKPSAPGRRDRPDEDDRTLAVWQRLGRRLHVRALTVATPSSIPA